MYGKKSFSIKAVFSRDISMKKLALTCPGKKFTQVICETQTTADFWLNGISKLLFVSSQTACKYLVYESISLPGRPARKQHSFLFTLTAYPLSVHGNVFWLLQ